MTDITKLGLNTAYIDTKRKETPQFKSLDEAVQFANKDAGDEAIVAVKDEQGNEQFAVVDLKAGAQASALFEPNSGVSFGALITRQDKKIEFVANPAESQDISYNRTLSMARMAAHDNVSGLKSSEAYDQTAGKMPTLQANLSTVMSQLNATEKVLADQQTKLKGEIAELEAASPKDENAIAGKKRELSQSETRSKEVTVYREIMTARMQILPQSQLTIPGSETKIGSLRGKGPEALKPLTARIESLEKDLAAEQAKPDPKDIETITRLKAQISDLRSSVSNVTVQDLQAKQAAIAIRIRIGSLVKIDDALGKAQSKLAGQQSELAKLHQDLKNAPTDQIKQGIEAKVKKLEGEIESTRKDLIKTMEQERDTFTKHAPRVGGKLQKGAQAAVDLLNTQIAKLKSVEGLPADKIGAAVSEVQKTYREAELLQEVKDAAKTFSGITPIEGQKIGEIVGKTNQYLTDYEKAKSDLKDLEVDIAAAKKMQMKFGPATQLPFEYDRLSDAKYWAPGNGVISGSEGNIQITQTYHEMDADFTTNYLGPGENGTVPSWITFAKSGSGSAGAQIGNVETAIEAIKQLTDGNITTDDARAIGALKDIVTQKGVPTQFLLLIEKIVNSGIDNVDPDVIKRGISDLQRMRTALVEGNTEIYNNAIPLFRTFTEAESKDGSGPAAVKKMLDDPKGLWSETSVKQQWAYHLGRSLTPAEEKMAADVAKQNRGLITRAFEGYKKAHSLYEQSKLPSTDPTERKKLLAQHDALIRQANMDFVSFEQLFAQPIYNKIHDLTGAMTGTVKLYDAQHPQSGEGITLLRNMSGDKAYKGTIDVAGDLTGVNAPTDGNWADFKTRMGFVEVSVKPGEEKKAEAEGARKLTIPTVERDASGNVKQPISMVSKTVWVKPDPKLTATNDQSLTTRGTISDYFLSTPSGKDADALVYGTPPMAQKNYTYVAPSTTEKAVNYGIDGAIIAVSPVGAVVKELTVDQVTEKVYKETGPALVSDAAQRKIDDEKRRKAMESAYPNK